MINYFGGLPQKPKGKAGRTSLDAANDLVRKTLAQHGLAPGGSDAQAAFPGTGAGLGDLMAQFTGPSFGAPPQQARQQAPLPEGAVFHARDFSCAAGSRSYRSYVPASAAKGARGIVVMLHGCTQTPEDFAAGTGMNALAETHGLVVIYPAQSRGDNAQSCWNWFSRGDQRRDRGEPAILAGITRQAMAEHGVARDRTFVAGLSAGAAMAVILGETYPDVFSAVGAHSGLPYAAARDVASAFAAMSSGAPDPARPLPEPPAMRTIVFHGSADTTVHPDNGARIAARAMDRGTRQTIETEVQGKVAGRRYTCKASAATDGQSELEYWVIDGLGHAWSGGQPAGSYTDANGPDASAEMVRFFLAAQA